MADEREQADDDEPEGAVARLFNLDTKEVSVVDVAANKRRFLVRKRDGSQEVLETADAVVKKDPMTPAPVPAAKTKTKKNVVRWTDTFLESLQELRHAIEEAPTSDSATAIPRSLALDLREIQLGLKKLAEAKHSGGERHHLSYVGGWSARETSLMPLGAACKKDVLAALAAAEKQLTSLRGDFEGESVLEPEQAKAVAGTADQIGEVLANHPSETAKRVLVAKSGDVALAPAERAAALATIAKASEALLDLEGTLRTDSLALDRGGFEACASGVFTLFKSLSKEVPVSDPVTPAPVAKEGRRMNGDRLTRLQGAVKMLKEAVGELKSGSVSLEKFDKVASIISGVVSECDVAKFIAQATKTAKMLGATDIREASPLAPNVGAGYQPDTSSVTDASYVFGDTVPGSPVSIADVMKRVTLLEKGAAESRATIAKRDAKIAALQAEVSEVKKFREAPATFPDDGDGFAVPAAESDAPVHWGMDMAAELENDRLSAES